MRDVEGEKDKTVDEVREQVAATRLVELRPHFLKQHWAKLIQILKHRYVIRGLVAAILLIVSIGVTLLMYTWDQHLIADGVVVSGINVSHLTFDQAQAKVIEEVHRLENQTIQLNVEQQKLEMHLNDLGLSINSDTALQEAYAIGRRGSLFAKASEKLSANKGLSVNFTQKWDHEKFKAALYEKLKSFNKPAVDASFDLTNENTMNIKSEQIGRAVDTDALISIIEKLNIYQPMNSIDVGFKEQQPKVFASQLESQKINGLLASFTTHFDPTQTGRTENIRLAAKALDKSMIKPGDTFSFNQIIGPRTEEEGYKDAFIIVNGQFVPGLGGGVCQVSSTLYNTGLLADLSVVEHNNHDLAITYVPLGQDATVAYPDLDLKFNNNSEGYLLIRTIMHYNTLTIEMYGKTKPGQQVVITDSTQSVIPAGEQQVKNPELTPGTTRVIQKGQPGYVVSSIRVVKVNGQVVSTESLGQSRYKPVPTIIEVAP